MSQYSNKSVKDLEKILKSHRNKSQKRRPSESEKAANVKKIKEKIKKLKLGLATLKYDKNQILAERGDCQAKQDELQEKVKSSRQLLTEYKQQTQAITSELRQAMGNSKDRLRRIKDPKTRLEDLEMELSREKTRLRCDDLSTGEEKKAMRNIKVLEGQIEAVKKYQDKNVEQVFKKNDAAKAKQDEVRKTHNEIFEEFKKAKDANTSVINRVKANDKEQQEAKDDIKTLQTQLKKMETDFKSQQMDFDSWRREEGEILSALAEAREMAKWSKSPSHNGPTSTSSNSSSAPNESKESSAPKKEENVPTLQEMRSAALKEYEAIQAKLRAKQPTAAPASSDPEAESAPTSKVADPHQAEKDLCQELIAYCKSNMPAEPSKDSSPKKKKKKRKKKKIRLTHKPINFTNFAKVGVGIPIWSTDLAKCIKALEDKISSYDNPEEQEDVKEQSV